METIERKLTAWVTEAFEGLHGKGVAASAKLDVVATTDPQFGDYQCNAAMALAKVLKQKPREIAEAFVAHVEAHEFVEKLEVAGPGFINIFLSNAWLEGYISEMAGDARVGVPEIGANRTVVLDYSSPNVAKPMHIGHIRSTVIGNALDRLHRFLGFRVIADNHLGDWGTQFGILIMGYRNFLDEAALRESPVEELERLYVKSYECSKEDDSWLDQARAELVKLQQGDSENLELWEKFVQLSLGEFDRIYDRLDVRFDLVRGESYYRDRLSNVIDELKEKKLAIRSEGALVVDLEEDKLPICIVQKSDGASNYATTDLATVQSRVEEFDPEAIIYVTDERQQLHFKQIFTICRKMGITHRLDHVWFGLMRLPEGTFSTREGNVIRLESLLDEAERRALEIVKSSSPDMPEDAQQEVARCVGIGAVKYADLSQNPQSLVTFTWEKAMALDGNSAPYLQYAYARIASVKDKYADQFPDSDPASFPIVLQEDIERELAIQLLKFPDTVIRAAEKYRPNILADYLYSLAQLYSSFYQNVPFLKAPEGVRESRVRLSSLVARTIKQGLSLLGIETAERI